LCLIAANLHIYGSTHHEPLKLFLMALYILECHDSLINHKIYVMRTQEIQVFEFNELDTNAKLIAFQDNWDINVDYQWWEDIYRDAKDIGLKITGHGLIGLDQGYCNAEFNDIPTNIANRIIANHGENCDTHKHAKSFLSYWKKLVEDFSDGISLDRVAEGKEQEFDDEADTMEGTFLDMLKSDYLTMLTQDYEYRLSQEAIAESIIINEYEFLSNGERFDI
jgi:hypothetical protein